MEPVRGFTDSALSTLQQHNWPGNIRELKNAVERSLFRWDDPDTPVAIVIIDPFTSPFEDEQPLAPEGKPEGAPVKDENTGDFQTQVKQLEVKLLRAALAKNGENQRRTATALGLSYNQMRGLVRKYKLAGPIKRNKT